MAETDWMATSWINADWPAPAHIRAGVTTRSGGLSPGPYDSLNLAQHVGDTPTLVEQNRARLREELQLPAEPLWLEQVHGCAIGTDSNVLEEKPLQADARLSRTAGVVCTVMTADCLPVLLVDKAGSCVAAVHAGWRGLVQEIILRTVDAMDIDKQQLLVWFGPAIGPDAFEVGSEVRQQFVEQNPRYSEAFVGTRSQDKWLMDIYQLARLQLKGYGVEQIYGGGFCTYRDSDRFFSYRRDRVTGRMASLIWMQA